MEQQSMRVIDFSIIVLMVFLISLKTFADNTYEFEGKYQVGSTTCSVKPIMMAFEVRWTRGKGSMVFFFDRQTADGKYIYVSEKKSDGRDHFQFDNKRMLSGKFIRSDGKVFPVKKIPPKLLGEDNKNF